MVYQDVAGGDKLQKLQDRFCEVARVSVCCVRSWDEPLTRFGGDAVDVEKIKEMLSPEQVRCLVRRVSVDSIENQAVETTEYPYLRLAAVSAAVEGQSPLTWIVCGIVSDAEGVENPEALTQEWHAVITERELYQAIDLLYDMTDYLVKAADVSAYTLPEQERGQFSGKALEELLRRSEAMMCIIRLMGDGEASEKGMERLLACMGSYLGCFAAQIFRRTDASCKPETVAEWHLDSAVDLDRAETAPDDGGIPWNANMEKPLVISYDTELPAKDRDALNRRHVHAIMCFPIRVGGTVEWYAYFEDGRTDRRWSVEEVKFVRDALNVLENLLYRQGKEASLTALNRSLEEVLAHIGSAVYVRDAQDGALLYANESLKELFAQEWREQRLDSLLPEEGAELFHESTQRWYDVRSRKIAWTGGREACLYTLYDITDSKMRGIAQERRMCMEYLVSLYQRTCCERDLARLSQEAGKLGRQGALLYVSLQGFGAVGDGARCPEGVLLQSVSDSLKNIDGIENNCYRMEEDSLVVIVPPAGQEKLELLLEEIRRLSSKPFYWRRTPYRCVFRIGTAYFPQGGSSPGSREKPQELIQRAKADCLSGQATDAADGVNRSDAMEIADGVTIRRRQFEVYFQPVMEMRGGSVRCVGAEALVHWNRDGEAAGSSVSASVIPLTECLGLVTPIGNHVLYEACLACREWNEHGHPEYRVSVALSAVQLLQTDIVGTVGRILKQTGIAPEHLTLTIAESPALHGMPRMRRMLGKIKKFGVRLVLDGLGSGEASFGTVRGSLFDGFCVERRFVGGLADDVVSQAFLKFSGELAAAGGKHIRVSGIETQAQLAVLQEMDVFRSLEEKGAFTAQGPYFAGAVPRKAFEEEYRN